MFHRVKSEVQPESAEQPKQAPKQEEAKIAETVQFESVTTVEEAPALSEQTPSESTETNPSINPQKETQTMSDSNTETQTAATNENADASSFQRPSTPVQASGGYPGSYPGYSAPSAGQEAASGDRRLTIGAGITMSGEIESCDYLLVEGTVEAALKGASVLDIAESGVFYGTVEIADATIAGRFEGDITAHGRLTLREGASVTGTISYKELEIEAGAIIDGKLTPLGAAPAAAKPAPSAAKKATAKPAGKESKAQNEVKPEPANTDGGLFTKTAAVAE